MPVNSTHPSYDAAASKWKRVRDASAGQDAVHAAGVLYLPKLKDQTEDDYNAYKARASYFNATGRTIGGLVGMVFRKPVEAEQAGIDNIIADIDLTGTNLDSFAQEITKELLTVSRIGVIVEYPQVADNVKTQADAAAINLRPYASVYKTESIINWKEQRVNNVMQPVMVMLSETAKDETDPYQPKEIPQLRELALVNGVYYQQLYRQNEKKEWVQFENPIVPLINGKSLGFIPFYVFGTEANELTITDAPMLSLADLNLAHYRVTADYEHGCHFTGLPMLFLAGVETERDNAGNPLPIYLGSQSAVMATNADAKGSFIEFAGQGLGALEKNLDRKETQMAVLGARMLEAQKAGVEAEGTMKMRTNGEASTLAALANLISAQLSRMLTFMALWAGSSSEVIAKLNTDYNPTNMTAQELTALVTSWQAGAISEKTLFNNLQRGEIIADATTFEDEQEEKSKQTPTLAK